MAKYILSFLIVSLLISCSNIKNNFVKNNFCYDNKLFNRELGISATLFGDMQHIEINKRAIKKVKSIVKEIEFLNNKMTIVDYSKATSGIYYESLIFFIKNDNSNIPDGLIVNDIEKNYVLYKKSDKKSSVYILLKSFETNISNANSTLLIDAQTLSESITFENSELNKTTYFDVFNGVREIDNYLVAREKINNAPLQQNEQQKFNKFQFLATINSFISNNKEYDSLFLKKEQKLKSIYNKRVDSLLKNKKHSNALQEFDSIIKNKQVVMLNEIHWSPKNRILATKLLNNLKENGFKYFAVEAIEKGKDSILNIRKYPSKDTGYYTKEPYFAHLIRIAKSLNFEIIQYDDLSTNEDRELVQAYNLKKIIDKDSTAKIFVYAGIDHILEINPSKKRMAEYFKELTKIDPLTLNQIKISSDIPTEFEIFPSTDFNTFNGLSTNVDFYIVNNIKPSLIDLYKDEEFGKLNLKFKKLRINKKENTLVRIYKENEYNKLKFNAIPISIFIYDIENTIIELPKGNYFIQFSTLKNDSLFEDFINVE
jgi:hypothetical protein